MERNTMDALNFIKEEPETTKCFDLNFEYHNTLDSYFTFGSKESCNNNIEAKEFSDDTKNSLDLWKAKSSYRPKLLVKLVPLEYSKNWEVQKYLKSFMPTAEPISEETTAAETELNEKVKMEFVELETLTENTLIRSSLETRYASPWDFVEVPDRYGQISSASRNLERKLRDHATDFEQPKNVQEKNDENKMIQKKIDKTVKNFFHRGGNQPAKRTVKLSGNSSTVHDVEKLWGCDTCKKTFEGRKNLLQHMRTHDRKTYTCPKCPRSYSYKSTLRRHAVIHNGENVTRKPDLIVDRDYKIGVKKPKIMDDKKLETETADKLYECDVCQKRFEKKSSLRVHIKFLHIKFYREEINKPQPEFKRKSFKCKICAKRYTQSSHLYRHEATHLSYKMYHCEECDISFSRRSTQSRHMLHKHSELFLGRSSETRKKVEVSPKIYDCKICGKSFKTHYDLRRHCATHDGRKPYECDTCKKQFALKSYLYAHVLTHDNWKPYPCNKCSKCYRRKSSLQRHLELSHSGDESNECNICHKVYKYLKSYNAHMENHR